MMDIQCINKAQQKALKVAVKGLDTFSEVTEKLSLKVGQEYSVSHVSKILNGYARPSYELAEAIIKVANENIRKSRTKKWAKKFKESGIQVKARKFELRKLPVAKHAGNTHAYFERTPHHGAFQRYETGLGVSVAFLADKLHVSERTLQRYVKGDIPASWYKAQTVKLAGHSFHNKANVAQHIFNHSVAAECQRNK